MTALLPKSRNIILAAMIRRVSAEHPEWPTRLILHVASKRLSER